MPAFIQRFPNKNFDVKFIFGMFYFDNIYGKKVLKSDLLSDINAFFTTKEDFDFKKLNSKRVLSPIQTHSDNVTFVDSRMEYPNTDGLILTNSSDTIFLRFADCTPLIFYDKKQKIAAISHAGWRGTAQRIGIKTIQKMQSNPSDIIAIIGPAISMCCYEVSEEVRDILLATVKQTDKLYKNRNVDLKKINAQQLKEIGVKEIDICPYCTSCDNDLFYSYRRENGTKERHMAVVNLAKEKNG